MGTRKTTKNSPRDPYGAEARVNDATELKTYARIMEKSATEHFNQAATAMMAAVKARQMAKKLLAGSNDPDLMAFMFAFKQELE